MIARKITLLWIVIFLWTIPVRAQSQGGAKVTNLKPFLITSTYGVIAGSLIGFGSLAFYETPRDNLRNVAIGASLGLYTGILIGVYAVYVLPMFEKPAQNTPSEDPLELHGFHMYPTLQWASKTPIPSLGFETKF